MFHIYANPKEKTKQKRKGTAIAKKRKNQRKEIQTSQDHTYHTYHQPKKKLKQRKKVRNIRSENGQKQ